MELVISLLQKGLLEKALDLAISESFFNARSPDDIKKALKIGYDINAVNSNGNNAIFACRTLEAMDCLLSYGINIHHINGHGQNALFHKKMVMTPTY
ncbi:hypothetical protein [Escherichia coli]|uniref:hypothetical protein n=1 Tax=Escherichia coli TaxID=562 RepID=UPI002ABB4714|nr:hypothetical protein [Escherichia coli]MDZ3911295.1 hypothetical protein [Escherichia coli]